MHNWVKCVFFWVWQANNLHQLTQNMTRIFWEFTWIKYVLKSVVDPDLEKCLFAFFFFLKSKDFSTYFIWSQTTFNWWKNEGLCRWESSYQKNFNPLLDFFGIVSDFLRFINKSLRYYIIKIKRSSCFDYGNKKSTENIFKHLRLEEYDLIKSWMWDSPNVAPLNLKVVIIRKS